MDAFKDTGKYWTSSAYAIVKFNSNQLQMRRNVFKYGWDRKLNSKFGKKILSL